MEITKINGQNANYPSILGGRSNIITSVSNGAHDGMARSWLIEAMSDKGKDRTPDENPTSGVVVQSKPKTRKPSMYKVIMLNDDYTPMEFVVMVLEQVFNKSHEESVQIMLHVHQKGVGICGVYTYEVAETKVTQVMDLAQQQQHQHPLQCTLEKE